MRASRLYDVSPPPDGQIASSIAENHKRRPPSIHPSIDRSIDRLIEYAWARDFTLRVLLGLLRSSKSDSCVNNLAGFDKTFPHGKVIRYVCSSVACFGSRNGMDSRITALASLTLVLPCNVDSAKRVSAAPALVLMFYGFLLGWLLCPFCVSFWPRKLYRTVVRSIDGTYGVTGFFALSLQARTYVHTSTTVSIIDCLLSAMLLLCLLRTFTSSF